MHSLADRRHPADKRKKQNNPEHIPAGTSRSRRVGREDED